MLFEFRKENENWIERKTKYGVKRERLNEQLYAKTKEKSSTLKNVLG